MMMKVHVFKQPWYLEPIIDKLKIYTYEFDRIDICYVRVLGEIVITHVIERERSYRLVMGVLTRSLKERAKQESVLRSWKA